MTPNQTYIVFTIAFIAGLILCDSSPIVTKEIKKRDPALYWVVNVAITFVSTVIAFELVEWIN